MKKLLSAAVVLAVAVAGGIRLTHGQAQKKAASAPKTAPPAVVTVATAVRKGVPVTLSAFGTVRANQVVAVRSLLTGPLTRVHFSEGQSVKKGDLLFTIDPRPFQAALAQAEANRARNAAQWENAKKLAARQADLQKRGFASEESRDEAVTLCDALAAAVRADDAAIETARLQVEYCAIRSPIDGRTGKLLVDEGNMVKANDVTLVTINQVSPIKADFAVPQQERTRIVRRLEAGPVPVIAAAPGAKGAGEAGALSLVDNAVDPATGMIGLSATFANASGALWPGQFVNIAVSLGVQTNVVVVPPQAVQTGQRGSYVFIVGADMSAEMRPVTAERTVDADTVIAAGLDGGETVVTDGHLRLRPGTRVSVKAPADVEPRKRS